MSISRGLSSTRAGGRHHEHQQWPFPISGQVASIIPISREALSSVRLMSISKKAPSSFRPGGQQHERRREAFSSVRAGNQLSSIRAGGHYHEHQQGGCF